MASNEASQTHTHDSTRPAKSGSRRRHWMQEIKAVSSNSNRGVPNQHTHPQISFTRGHASWEKGKTLLAQKETDCVFIRDVF